jgi:signal transduction protein with GAF and PtsI domain
VLLLDEAANELVFEAVVGEGEETLLGQRFPAGTGVAGWVLATRTPLVIEDVRRDPRFAKDVAEDTGYVPEGLMAVPLLSDERALGVLEVLDRQAKFTLQEMELLGLFAAQAAIALDLLQRARDGRPGRGGARRSGRRGGRAAAGGARGGIALDKERGPLARASSSARLARTYFPPCLRWASTSSASSSPPSSVILPPCRRCASTSSFSS